MFCYSQKVDKLVLLFSPTSSTPSPIAHAADAGGLQSHMAHTPAKSSWYLLQTHSACGIFVLAIIKRMQTANVLVGWLYITNSNIIWRPI